MGIESCFEFAVGDPFCHGKIYKFKLFGIPVSSDKK
jgi:hypothetical protein